MKRRGFLTRLFGGATVAAAAAVLPKAQEAVAQVKAIAQAPRVPIEVEEQFVCIACCSCSSDEFYYPEQVTRRTPS